MSIFLPAFFMCNFILVQASDPFTYNKKDPCSRHCMYDYHVPVCGSDGVTYFNECVMKVYACWARVDTTVLHHGKCFPKQVEHSQCEHHCSKVVSPVCGTDGKTYNNECLLNQERCYNGTQLTKQYDGFCLTRNSYTAACGRKVNLKYHPVCGSDGVSYINKDVLSKTACHNLDFDLRVKSFGECGYKKKARKRCRSVMKKDYKYEPVCGSDYKTHENTAVLEYRKCLQQPAHLTVMYKGECRFKSKVTKQNSSKENTTKKQQPTNSPTSTKNTPTLPKKPPTSMPPPPPPMPPSPPPSLTTTAPVKKSTTHYTTTSAVTMADRPTDDQQKTTKRLTTQKSLVNVAKTDILTVSKTNRVSPKVNEITDMDTDELIATEKITSPTNVTTSPSDMDATPSDKTEPEPEPEQTSSRGMSIVTVSNAIQESTMINKVTDMITDQPIATEESSSPTNAIIELNTPSDGTTLPSGQDSTQSNKEGTSDVVTVSNTIQKSTTINTITDMVTDEPIVTEKVSSPTNAIIQSSTSSDGTPPSDMDATSTDIKSTQNDVDTVTETPIKTEEILLQTNVVSDITESLTLSDGTTPLSDLNVGFSRISKSKPPKIEDKSVPWGYWKPTPFPSPRRRVTEKGSQEVTNIMTERITILETILSGIETVTRVSDIENTQVKETLSSVEHTAKEELTSTTNLDKDTSSVKFFITEEPLKMPLHLTDKTNVETTSIPEINTVGVGGRFEEGFITLETGVTDKTMFDAGDTETTKETPTEDFLFSKATTEQTMKHEMNINVTTFSMFDTDKATNGIQESIQTEIVTEVKTEIVELESQTEVVTDANTGESS